MFKQILEGWGNKILDEFNLLDEDTKRMARQRLEVCNTCKVRIKNSCSTKKQTIHRKTGQLVGGCGCNIAAKTLSPSSECPAAKWPV